MRVLKINFVKAMFHDMNFKNIFEKNEDKSSHQKLIDKMSEAYALGLTLNKISIIDYAKATSYDMAMKAVEKSISDFKEREKMKLVSPLEWIKQEVYNYVSEFQFGNASLFHEYEKEINEKLGDNPTLEEAEKLKKEIIGY